jgi:hypothetical protein
MRASAAFPVRVKKVELDTVVTFLGYWLLKRDIKEVTAILTLRSASGEVASVESHLIDQVKSYTWSMSEMIKHAGIKDQNNFLGSIEVEIFSARDLVFPYPAITFAYVTAFGTSFVHSCGRIYNNLQDMSDNNEQVVAETGFDIISKEGYEPYFSFVNGPFKIGDEVIKLEFINTDGEKLCVERHLKEINAYATAWVNLIDDDVAREFFKGRRGTVKIHHNLKGFFPRFVAGNMYNGGDAISLTHSYYDTSRDESISSKWKNPGTDNFFDSVISFPVSADYEYTELALYPNLVQHKTVLSFEFYDGKGNYIGLHQEKLSIGEEQDRVRYIDCRKLLENLSVLEEGKTYLCKVVCDGCGTVPTRMKFGLNIGNSKKVDLPSNICFNADLPNEKIPNKPGAFKWCTIFDAENQSVFVTNASFLKRNRPSADLTVSFWRQNDGESLDRNVTVPSDGVCDILDGVRNELAEFLNGEIGWVSIRSSSPFVNGYYVTDYGMGVVGADHLY